jgi:hypothetical protein
MNGGDELRDLWSSQPPFGNTKGEEIMALVQRKTKRFERMIMIRNWTECLAAAVVTVAFGVLAILAGDAFTRTGAAIVAASAAWIIYYISRHGKANLSVDPSQNLTGYTQALLKHYDHQIKLLRSAKYWYLLPMYIGLLVISAPQLARFGRTRLLHGHLRRHLVAQ